MFVTADCSNTPTSTINLFKFPKDPVLRAKWVSQVRRTHAQWEATEHSILCSENFTEDCFEVNAKFWHVEAKEAQGRCNPQDIREKVRETSVDVGKRPCDQDTPTAPPKRPCRAVEKQDRVRVSNCTCCHTSMSIYMYTNDCLFTSVNNTFITDR